MSPIFGKLTWAAIPVHEPIALITSIVVIPESTRSGSFSIAERHVPSRVNVPM